MLSCPHFNPSVDESYTTEMAITETLLHEIDVLHWLVDDDYARVEVFYPKQTKNKAPHLKDPQIICFITKSGIAIQVEVFVNGQYAYDIQCRVVGENGVLFLSETSGIGIRKDTKRSKNLLMDWKERFLDAYDNEFQAFLKAVKATNSKVYPTAWDGDIAAVIADACLKAQKSGQLEKMDWPKVPRFYQM